MRILVCGDTHCGHVGGLAPPGWLGDGKAWPGWAAARASAWERWRAIHRRYGPYDAAVFTGDGIDGRGEKDLGADCLLPDQTRQAECLAEVLGSVPFRGRRPAWAACYGTEYHVGRCEAFERLAYDAAGIRPELRGDVVSFRLGPRLVELRHDIGSAGTLVGGDLALRREALTAREWAAQHDGDAPTVMLRGHAHYCRILSDAAGWHVAVAPSLQLWTRFGARRVHGRIVHWGVLLLDLDPRTGDCAWHPIVTPLDSFRPAGDPPRLA